ncbi:hypothetical protein SB48_HM08orf05878 [Heyndrickxia coagulans]|uniref:Uncharacterized protein n=1 Tax=Heyndrickxia coagulans TaxID=1398 RepID=A0AAN0WDP8_HEYCO|nr:hypothetical protein SB48_HM08orf05878 [Heyndrickxia coagulans]KYC63755.1 hypothetical protein B4100_0973 [Heyndrickxia coagulans]
MAAARRFGVKPFFKKAGPLLCPNPTANPVSVIREDVKL